MSAFAPPPYSHERSDSNGADDTYVLDADKRKIAAVWGNRGEKEATCTLFQASPELFELLSLALDDYQQNHGKVKNAAHWAFRARMLFEEIAL